MNRQPPPIHSVTLQELDFYRQLAPPPRLHLFRIYVDIRSGDLFRLEGLVAPKDCVEVKPRHGGESSFPLRSNLREYVTEPVQLPASAPPPAKELGCGELFLKFLAYSVLIIVLFFGLIFGFCAMGAAVADAVHHYLHQDPLSPRSG